MKSTNNHVLTFNKQSVVELNQATIAGINSGITPSWSAALVGSTPALAVVGVTLVGAAIYTAL